MEEINNQVNNLAAAAVDNLLLDHILVVEDIMEDEEDDDGAGSGSGNDNDDGDDDNSDSDDDGSENENPNPNKKQKLEELEEVEEQLLEPNDDDEAEDINPFLVDKILDSMMGQMEIEDILNVRSVCSVWDERAIDRLVSIRKTLMPIDLDTDQNYTNFKGMMYFSENQKLFRKFVIHWKIFKSMPFKFFTEFRPTMMRIVLNNEEGDLDLSTLMKKLEQCSQHLKLLSIYRSTSKKMLLKETGDLDAQNALLDVNFPQLESIQIGYMRREFIEVDVDDEDDDPLQPPIILQEPTESNNLDFLVQVFKSLINGSPKLSQIKLMGLPNRSKLLSNELFTNEEGGFAENVILKLKHLTCIFTGFWKGFTPSFLMSQFNLLNGQGQLNLLSFEIKFEATYRSDNEAINVKNELIDLKNFILSQKDTLETLNISLGVSYESFHYVKDVVLTLPPIMNNLKKLTLKNTTCDDDAFESEEELLPYPFTPLNLSIQFPQLCEITFNSTVIFQGLKSILVGASNTVKKVTLETDNYEPELVDLSAYFPSVTTFKIRFSSFYNPDKDPIQFPWGNTLTTLILDITPNTLQNFNFANLFHLSKLTNLEINNMKRINIGMNDLRLVSLKKLKIKHLRIKDFRLADSIVSELGEAFMGYFVYLCLPVVPVPETPTPQETSLYRLNLNDETDSQFSFDDSLP